MADIAKMVGGGLVAAGVVFGIVSALGDFSPTALIPAFFGIAFLAIGMVSAAKPELNKHLMHVGALVALLGILGSFMPIIAGGAVKILSGLVLLAACAFFLVKAIQSFKAARLARG